MKKQLKRIHFLDELRGFAIVCMVFHHFFLDVGDVLGLQWGYTVFYLLCSVQPAFWAIFIVISGVCSTLSRNTVKRGFLVLGCGCAVTLVTAGFMPLIGITGAEIYFGILSCLGCCMILCGLLMKRLKKVNIKAGMILSLLLFFVFYEISDGSIFFHLIQLPDALYSMNWLVPLGIYSDTFYSADYFGIVPWIFLFSFGMFAGLYAREQSYPGWMYQKRSKMLAFFGKNSLWVYLAHQVVLYAILYAVYFLLW